MEDSQKPSPRNKKELLVSSGYSVISATASAKDIIEQKGVQKELSALGFTVDNAKSVTTQILLNDKEQSKDRLKAADMVFKVHGAYVPEPSAPVTNIQNVFFDTKIQIATKDYEASLKKLLANEPPQYIQEEDTANN